MNDSKTRASWSDGGYGLSRRVWVTYVPPELDKRAMFEEYEMVIAQVWESEGFDIDFGKFRCEFNFKPFPLDGEYLCNEGETDGDFMKALSELALEVYNKEKGTKIEFFRVLKANGHPSAGLTFYITFEVHEDHQIKLFQAVVRHLNENDTEVEFCRPKPDKEDIFSLAVSLEGVPPELHEPSSPKRQKTGDEEGKHRMSVEDEYTMFEEQVLNSEGFDIDFDKFRCEFNFKPVDLDGSRFNYEHETDRDLMNALSELAIKEHNQETGSNLRFMKVVEANWRPNSGCVFFITFEVDECNQVIEYQAMVHYLFKVRKVILCRVKPCKMIS